MSPTSNIFARLSLCAGLTLALTGCGKNNQSSDSVGSGGATIRKPVHKATDTQLVKGSNDVPVYSTPDSARKAMRRNPDQTVDEGNGVTAQYYNGDQTNANSERLRLRYAQNRLIGKEIVPADSSASAPAVINTSAATPGAVNVQGLDAETTSSKAGAGARSTGNYGTNNYYGNGSPSNTGALRGGSNSDRANSRANDDFNAKLNASQRRY